jgi:uncharacterized protein (TIGR03032 family)
LEGADAAETLQCDVTPGFARWISDARVSLAITTYQANKVILVGWDGERVTVLPRHFDKPMGLAVRGKQLAVATRHEVILLADASLLAHDYLENQRGRYDALYLPRTSFFTGDINVHDLAFAHDDLWLVNTRFSCLASPSALYSFVPRWKPSFVTEIAPEDRCHLNGLAEVNGIAKFVTALGATNTPGGWRAEKASGGIVIDVENNDVVVRRLSMPHSPRWHEDRLWVLNSGMGELWQVDSRSGTHAVVCALPGYLRGLCFIGNYALVGLSQIRERHIFGGLPVQDRHKQLRCGVAVVDLRSGTSIGMLEFTGGCAETFDVAVLPASRPSILSREKEASRLAFTAPEFSYWLRPSAITTELSGANESDAKR